MKIDIIIIKEAGVQDEIHNPRLQEGVKIFFPAGNHERHLQEDQYQDHVHPQGTKHLIGANHRLKDYLMELDLEVEAKVRKGIVRQQNIPGIPLSFHQKKKGQKWIVLDFCF